MNPQDPDQGPAAGGDEQATPALFDGRFDGRETFTSILRAAVGHAAAAGWREMVWCDADFEDWPLGERAFEAALLAWSRTGRRLTLLACRYDAVVDRHARFVRWRRDWSHIVEARVLAGVHAQDCPSAWWTPDWVLHRIDPERCHGVCTRDASRRVALRENLDEFLRRSAPGFPAVTLGL